MLKLGNGRSPYAIIIGLDSLQGLQAARILAHRRVPVIAMASDPRHHNCQTKVCQQILFAKRSEALVSTLASLGPQLDHKAVLVPCTDKYVRLVSRRRADLEPWYHVVLPSSDTVEMLMDKINFYTYAQRAGLPIPKTFFLYSREDVREAAQHLTFPCLLKPPFRSGDWLRNTKKKAFIAAGAAELLSLYDHYRPWADALIAQEWIAGPDTNHYSCNCYFDANAEPLVTFVTRKLRQWPPEIGAGCLGEECRDDVVLQETVRLFKSVAYRGLGYVEMKRDERSGKYLIIEPNIGRPTGRSASAEASGVELLYTMYCDAIGWPLPTNREQTYQGVKWVHLLRDIQSAMHYWRRGELTLTEWLMSLRGPKVDALFSWQDPVPFLRAVQRSFPIYLSAREQGKDDYL